MKEEEVVLVDEYDKELGTMGKQQAHVEGALHRAFSIFLFDQRGQLLLQQRAPSKYHSGGLWTNTCCGHPRKGEDIRTAAQRRLREELGIDVQLVARFSFSYKASFPNGLHEHELDHVLFGSWTGSVMADPLEVQDHRSVSIEELDAELRTNPERYTAWLITCWPRVLEELRNRPILHS